MGIFISAGHYPKKPGAISRMYCTNEHKEALKVTDKLLDVIQKDKALHYCTVAVDTLRNKVEYINSNIKNKEHDIAVEIHFNSSGYSEANGMEVLYYPSSIKGKKLAKCMIESMCEYLPFKNRGIKHRKDLFFLRETKIPAIICEILFLSNNKDTCYLKLERSYDIIANAIYGGLLIYKHEETLS